MRRITSGRSGGPASNVRGLRGKGGPARHSLLHLNVHERLRGECESAAHNGGTIGPAAGECATRTTSKNEVVDQVRRTAAGSPHDNWAKACALRSSAQRWHVSAVPCQRGKMNQVTRGKSRPICLWSLA